MTADLKLAGEGPAFAPAPAPGTTGTTGTTGSDPGSGTVNSPATPDSSADRHRNVPELVDRLVQSALVLKCAAQLAEPLYREADCRLVAGLEIRHEQMLTQCRTVRRLVDEVGGILDARYQAGDPNRRQDPATASLHLAGD